MVNMDKENDEVDLEVTNEEQQMKKEDSEIIDIEEETGDKLKKLRDKLAHCEKEKKQILEDSQRAKADFLNARKRLEEERVRDRAYYRKQHVMEMLPLCDSFQMAMSNTEVWEKADKVWRTGIEGINNQLLKILESYGVESINPKGEHFNPHRHEAIGTENVEDEKMKDVILSVVQSGYEMTHGTDTEVIRPARVITGTFNE